MKNYLKKDKNYTQEELDEYFKDVIKKFSDKSKKRIWEAYKFASKSHKGQKRASGEHYLVHPIEVARSVLDLGLDDDSIIAALLHDVVEDCNVSLATLKKEFGEDIAQLVDSLTKINSLNSKKNKSIEGLKKILIASIKDIRVLIIKLMDRLNNMRTLEPFRDTKQQRISQETLDIYVPIAQKLGLYEIKWELEDLSFRYFNPEMYYYIKNKVKLKRTEREKVTKELVKEIKDTLDREKIEYVNILGRAKSFYSIFKKIKDKSRNIENLYDLYAIRIITKSIPDCYHILYFIHQHFNVFPNRLKDYIANPKGNGYQSIHTAVFSEMVKTPVELQIRTEEMHKIAEFGIAAHWRYKSLEKDKKFDKKIDWLREVMEWTKSNNQHDDFLKLLKFKFFEDEIFVFTPKNDVITLPEESTPVDFAYAVHTDIGKKVVRAKVNGEIISLDAKLKNGDIVEIMTNTNAKPNEKWLQTVKTSKARFKIRESLNIKHSGKKELETISDATILKYLIVPEGYKKIKKAGCCTIKVGDKVVGVLNKEKELIIHNSECENAKYSLNKKVAIKWKNNKDKSMTIDIVLEDKIGLMIDLLNIIADMNISMEKVNSKSTKDNKVRMSLTVNSDEEADKIINKIKEMENVINVSKAKNIFGF